MSKKPREPEFSMSSDRLRQRLLKRILFVDDEPVLVEVACRSLAWLGYRVTPPTSGPEALERFKATPGDFDVVVTDIALFEEHPLDYPWVDFLASSRSLARALVAAMTSICAVLTAMNPLR